MTKRELIEALELRTDIADDAEVVTEYVAHDCYEPIKEVCALRLKDSRYREAATGEPYRVALLLSIDD